VQPKQGSRGGKREGAGRPPILDKPMRQTVYLQQRHMHLITEWQEKYRMTFSEALRAILDSRR
jgi:hypothetical protein